MESKIVLKTSTRPNGIVIDLRNLSATASASFPQSGSDKKLIKAVVSKYRKSQGSRMRTIWADPNKDKDVNSILDLIYAPVKLGYHIGQIVTTLFGDLEMEKLRERSAAIQSGDRFEIQNVSDIRAVAPYIKQVSRGM